MTTVSGKGSIARRRAKCQVVEPQSTMMTSRGAEQLERAARDPLALLGQLALPLGQRRLDADRRQGGAAVGAADQAALAQRIEIAPHGLGRDAEGARQRGDTHRRIGAQLGDDPLAPLQLAEPHRPAHRAASSAAASSAKPAPPRASVTQAGSAASRPAKSRTLATPTVCAK